MATLSIGGKKVTVDDALLKAAPDVQNAAIEEIAKSIGVGQNDNVPLTGGASSSGPAAPSAAAPVAAPQGMVPGSPAYANWARDQAMAGKTLPQVSAPPPSSLPQDPLPPVVRSFAQNAVDLPIIGPTINKALGAGETPYQQDVASQWRQNAENQAPGAAIAGQVVANVAPFVVGGEIPAVSKALGMSGGWASRIVLGGLSNAGIAGADTLARGGNSGEAGNNAAISGGIAAALPVVGGLAGAVLKPTVGKALGTMRALFNPSGAADAAIAGAISKDAASGAAPMLSQADQASAAANGQNLLNVDLGGANTRALARVASVTNPDARATFSNVANDRFQAQGARAGNFIDTLMGGPVDDVAYQAHAAENASAANKAAYTKAYADPAAQSVFTPEIQQLMQSDQFRLAVKAAESTGTDRAAITGGQAVHSPFTFDANGVPSLKTMPDGSTATPSLQFWNEVKMNLDSKIGIAQRSGDNSGARDLIQLKKQLTGNLDAAVPSYQEARAGAAAAFQADNALEAGQKFVTQNLDPNTARAAMAKMTPQDREAFAVGFAAQLKNKVLNAPNRLDVINKIYGSDAATRKIVMALGQDRANQFEQFVRVENVMDGLRKMGGGSDTANKLAEMGAMGLGGSLIGGLTTGNWQQGGSAGLALGGARMLGSYANRQMMSKIAQILVSDDPTAMQRAVKLASSSPEGAQAVKALQKMLGTAARSAPLAIGAAASQQPQAAQP